MKYKGYTIKKTEIRNWDQDDTSYIQGIDNRRCISIDVRFSISHDKWGIIELVDTIQKAKLLIDKGVIDLLLKEKLLKKKADRIENLNRDIEYHKRSILELEEEMNELNNDLPKIRKKELP